MLAAPPPLAHTLNVMSFFRSPTESAPTPVPEDVEAALRRLEAVELVVVVVVVVMMVVTPPTTCSQVQGHPSLYECL